MRLDKKLKKKLLLNAPYILFVYLFDKVAQGICIRRLPEGQRGYGCCE